MKIRTDFVTNSSSSSFVTITLCGGDFNGRFSFDNGGNGYDSYNPKDMRSLFGTAKSPDDVVRVLSKSIGRQAFKQFSKNNSFDSFVQGIRATDSVKGLGRIEIKGEWHSDGIGSASRLTYDFSKGGGTFTRASLDDSVIRYSGDPVTTFDHWRPFDYDEFESAVIIIDETDNDDSSERDGLDEDALGQGVTSALCDTNSSFDEELSNDYGTEPIDARIACDSENTFSLLKDALAWQALVKVKLNGRSDLVAMSKGIAPKLESICDYGEYSIDADGLSVSLEGLDEVASFNLIEFELYECKIGDLRIFDDLLNEVSKAGVGYGALVMAPSSRGTFIKAYGDVHVEAMDFDSYDSWSEGYCGERVRWGTIVSPRVVFCLDESSLCEMMDCSAEVLKESIVSNDDRFLTTLLGEGLAERVFGPDLTGGSAFDINHEEIDTGSAIREVLPERGLVVCMPPYAAWGNNSTAHDFKEYREKYERMVDALKERGGWVDVSWCYSVDGDTFENVFTSEDDFRLMRFQSGPNCWGDFEAVSYEL